MKKTFTGMGNQVGSVMEFEGNQDVGSGKLELLKLVPNHLVEIKLTMKMPFTAENLIEYKLTPEASGTRFSWAMSGDSGFFGKLISLFFDCEKMVTSDFNTGIQNLKVLAEGQK
jgi:uncharacterized protein YndB with AHSA1/START domain